MKLVRIFLLNSIAAEKQNKRIKFRICSSVGHFQRSLCLPQVKKENTEFKDSEEHGCSPCYRKTFLSQQEWCLGAYKFIWTSGDTGKSEPGCNKGDEEEADRRKRKRGQETVKKIQHTTFKIVLHVSVPSGVQVDRQQRSHY